MTKIKVVQIAVVPVGSSGNLENAMSVWALDDQGRIWGRSVGGLIEDKWQQLDLPEEPEGT